MSDPPSGHITPVEGEIDLGKLFRANAHLTLRANGKHLAVYLKSSRGEVQGQSDWVKELIERMTKDRIPEAELRRLEAAHPKGFVWDLVHEVRRLRGLLLDAYDTLGTEAWCPQCGDLTTRGHRDFCRAAPVEAECKAIEAEQASGITAEAAKKIEAKG